MTHPVGFDNFGLKRLIGIIYTPDRFVILGFCSDCLSLWRRRLRMPPTSCYLIGALLFRCPTRPERSHLAPSFISEPNQTQRLIQELGSSFNQIEKKKKKKKKEKMKAKKREPKPNRKEIIPRRYWKRKLKTANQRVCCFRWWCQKSS